MSADRPLSARYDEPVFSNEEWSPTVAQALVVFKVSQGEELPDALIASFVGATKPQEREAVSELLATHNKIDPKIRKAAATLTMISARLSVLHSPDVPFSRDELHMRSLALMAAVGTVGLQMIDER